MKTNIKQLIIIVASGFLLLACDISEDDRFGGNFPAGRVNGYRPIYASPSDLLIEVVGPRTINKARKLYLYGDHLFINELNQGVHIINFSNPSLPIKTGFIKIYGNVDVAVKNGFMYADQAGSLITLDIRDLGNITVVSTLPNQFQDQTQYPEMVNGWYFECPDATKGKVIGWELVELDNPKCYR